MKQTIYEHSLAITSELVRNLVASAEAEDELLKKLKQAVVQGDIKAAFQIATELVGEE